MPAFLLGAGLAVAATALLWVAVPAPQAIPSRG
jgi:hypothetical protein